MSQSTVNPFGAPAPSVPAGLPPEPSGQSRRGVYLVLAAAVAAVVLGAVGFLALGGSDTPSTVGAPTSTPAGGTVSPTATTVPSPTSSPSDVVVNGRNPFLGKPSTAASSSTSTATQAAPTVTTTKTSTVTTTQTSTVTATVADTAVYLTLVDLVAGPPATATFLVNGTRYTKDPGDVFGAGSEFTYDQTVSSGGNTCAAVTYKTTQSTVCVGDQVQVA